MAKILRDLLEATEPTFTLSIRQLEKLSGESGVDTRLIGDIAMKMRSSIVELGLDPTDSTGQEIYAALMSRIADDNQRIAKMIGGKDPDNVAEMIPLIVKAVEKMKINRQVWVLKHEVARRLLTEMPPERLIKQLGYDSAEDMLDNEDIDEVYTAIRFSEGDDWLNQYNELFKAVTAIDFEHRDIRIIIMDHKKYVSLAAKFVQKKLHNITHTKELGTIVVVPMQQPRMKGITLKSLPLIFHYINEVRLYSAFFKLKQKKTNFGEIVVNTLIADPSNASSIAGHKVHWRVIQRYFGKLKDGDFPQAFEPHVHPEDLHWRRANEMLVELDPEMSFWLDKDYVGRLYDGVPLTLNMMDVSLSYANSEPYQEHYFYHFRESLWNEIFTSYMGKKNLKEQILDQLDNDLIAPHKLPLPDKPKQKSSLHKIKSDILLRQKLIAAAEGRLVGVTDEFEKAFDVLERYEKTVTVFGSARLSEDDPAYKSAYELGSALAAKGFTIVTGGGWGIMEAANRGAYESGGSSLGFNINLPTEQTLNDYVTESYEFEHFFGRKVTLTLDARAYVYFPGGFGTMDELFEILTLAQTGKIPRVPIILFGMKFWEPLTKYFVDTLDKSYATISPEDEHLYTVTDDIDEAVEVIVAHAEDYKQQPKGSKPRPRHAKQ